MVKFISNAEIQVLCCHMLGTLATTGKGWGGGREGREGGREGGRDKQAESNGVEKYCPVHFFHVAQQNDVLFTKEFISPICLSMRVRPKPNPMPGASLCFNCRPMLVPKTFSVQHALSLSPYHSMVRCALSLSPYHSMVRCALSLSPYHSMVRCALSYHSLVRWFCGCRKGLAQARMGSDAILNIVYHLACVIAIKATIIKLERLIFWSRSSVVSDSSPHPYFLSHVYLS